MEYHMDKLRIEGCIPVYPVGKQSVRRGLNGGFYIPKETKEYMSKVAHYARRLYQGEPLAVPLSVDVTYAFSTQGFRKKPKHSEYWMAQKPDCDNLDKALYDALSGLFWKDDCWIVERKSQKIWHESYGIWLAIRPATSSSE